MFLHKQWQAWRGGRKNAPKWCSFYTAPPSLASKRKVHLKHWHEEGRARKCPDAQAIWGLQLLCSSIQNLLPQGRFVFSPLKHYSLATFPQSCTLGWHAQILWQSPALPSPEQAGSGEELKEVPCPGGGLGQPSRGQAPTAFLPRNGVSTENTAPQSEEAVTPWCLLTGEETTEYSLSVRIMGSVPFRGCWCHTAEAPWGWTGQTRKPRQSKDALGTSLKLVSSYSSH